MRVTRALPLAALALAFFGTSAFAQNAPVVFSLTQSQTPTNFAGGTGVGQAVDVSETMTINDFSFFLDLKTAGTLDYFVYDKTTGIFALQPESVPVSVSPKAWDTLTLSTPLLLDAGNDYIFGVEDPNAASDYMTVGLIPVSEFSSDGLTAGTGYDFTGDTLTGPAAGDVAIQIGSYDPPPAAPEPSSLLLLGTGILAAAGVVRKRLPH
jgi:hypothetical protein